MCGIPVGWDLESGTYRYNLFGENSVLFPETKDRDLE